LSIEANLNQVQHNCARICKSAHRNVNDLELIAVSKTFSADDIKPALEAGHRVFGENKVQESQGKWPELKKEFSDVELHLIGPLQSNKAADAVALFDMIHTIDREKLAKIIAKEIKNQNKHPKLLVQVNTGSESQKAGIEPEKAEEFVAKCQNEYGLEISGLMCIPPLAENPGPHFALLRKLAKKMNLPMLSMGMSGDYETAIEMGATHIRVGSAIFGNRPPLKQV